MNIAKPLTFTIAVSAACTFSSETSAAVQIANGTFAPISEISEIYDYATSTGSAGSAIFEESTVTGITKFNPALGTLTDVTISYEAFYNYSIELYSTDLDDPGDASEMTVDLPEFDMFIGYQPGGGTTTHVLDGLSPVNNLSCFGTDEFGCFDFFSDGGFHSPASFSIFSDPNFDVNDFVGFGNVTALAAIIAIPTGADFTATNVLEGEASILATFQAEGPFTVIYEYDPIPEPASAMLLSLAGLALIVRRR